MLMSLKVRRAERADHVTQDKWEAYWLGAYRSPLSPKFLEIDRLFSPFLSLAEHLQGFGFEYDLVRPQPCTLLTASWFTYNSILGLLSDRYVLRCTNLQFVEQV